MKNIVRDAVLFLEIILICAVGRLVLLCMFNTNSDIPSLAWWTTSLRFDLQTAAFVILPTLALSFAGFFFLRDFRRLKMTYFVLSLALLLLTAGLNVLFFKEYKSQFNYWIFGIVYDDPKLILSSIWSMYPIARMALVFAAVLLLIFVNAKVVFGATEKFGNSGGGILKNGTWCLILSSFLFVAMRGGVDGRPLQFRDSVVETSEFLNNIIPTPEYCLKQEIAGLVAQTFSKGLSKFSAEKGDIASYAFEVFGKSAENLDKTLLRRAEGSPLKKKCSRVFLIVVESHSAWGTFDEFKKYGLMPETSKLQENALFCAAALASGGCTMPSVSSLISGIPYTGFDIRGVFSESKSCAIANILKRLGYSSTFFYAGQSTWMQLSDYAKSCGFDKMVGGEQMGDIFGSVEWGVRDKDMYNHILKTHIPENSFNMILTVSNHPPYDVDLRAEGCEADLSDREIEKLYHLWYSDKELGRFVRQMQKKYPDALFVVTGDHVGRVFPADMKRDAKISSAVPIIFCGDILSSAGIEREVLEAQHLDIIPTIVDILAPKGFEYSAWGFSMLSERKLPPMNVGMSILNGKFIPSNSADCPKEISELIRKYFAVAYYLSMYGSEFSE